MKTSRDSDVEIVDEVLSDENDDEDIDVILNAPMLNESGVFEFLVASKIIIYLHILTLVFFLVTCVLLW